MDLNSNGRTWVGNIFQKFETIYQEVDDFVTKDSVKYVENQVQTVGESVKRFYSNVVEDFAPPLGDGKEAKAQAVAKKQIDSMGTYIRSVVGVKEKYTRSSDRQSSTEQDTVDLSSCDASEVECLRQFSPPHAADSPEVAESESFWEANDEAIDCYSEMVVEENVEGEEYQTPRYLSSPEDVSSSESSLYWREEYLRTENLESLEDGNLSWPSEISNDGGQRSIILVKFSPGNLVEDVWLSTSQKDMTAGNSTDLTEESETGSSLRQDFDAVVYNNYEMSAKKNATIEEHPASEHANSLEYRNSPSYESSSELSLHSREQHPLAEDSSTLEAVSLHKSSIISTNQDHMITTPDKFSTENSVNDEGLRVFQEEEGARNRTYPSKEAETDLSLGVEENELVEKHAVVEYLGSPEDKDSCYLSLCSQKMHPETEDLDCPKGENSSESSLISRAEDHTSIIGAKFLTVTSDHNARIRSSQKDETVADSFSDVLSSDPSSKLASLSISWEPTVVETEASSSSVELLNPLEIPHANYTRTEKICCDYTDSSGCASHSSSISSASFSDLASGNKDLNLIPAFPMTALSAGILDDSAFDISDANMETIDLSDKAKLEESCVLVDNELFYAASCRPRKFRSYKELIKEAFASRKRLIKEYKQLAIWYAGIDKETSLHAEQCLSPAARTLPEPDMGESEWEIL